MNQPDLSFGEFICLCPKRAKPWGSDIQVKRIISLTPLAQTVYTSECIQERPMQVTTKELRIQPGRIIEQVSHGEEITITYRGKRIAKIVPLEDYKTLVQDKEDSIFGLWENRTEGKTVDETVRDLRKGRQF